MFRLGVAYEYIKRRYYFFANENGFFNNDIENHKLNLIIEAGDVCKGIRDKNQTLIKKGIGGVIIYCVILYSMRTNYKSRQNNNYVFTFSKKKLIWDLDLILKIFQNLWTMQLMRNILQLKDSKNYLGYRRDFLFE
ncbi:hypothetical protein DDU33_07830 [Actinobacillus porcitonsillarum]|uniref:Uncharacterized protein n=1 Tax=Actinobacillus porcitonsillarum TaxID=189834 RepID=A0A2U8FK53_9PAST|nr:hypothetical protein DDU33_07830 [Actinobacillus porcitonsillarum]